MKQSTTNAFTVLPCKMGFVRLFLPLLIWQEETPFIRKSIIIIQLVECMTTRNSSWNPRWFVDVESHNERLVFISVNATTGSRVKFVYFLLMFNLRRKNCFDCIGWIQSDKLKWHLEPSSRDLEMFQLNLTMVQNFITFLGIFATYLLLLKNSDRVRKFCYSSARVLYFWLKNLRRNCSAACVSHQRWYCLIFLESDTTCQLKAWHVNHDMPLRKKQCLGQKVIHLLLDKIELNLKYFLKES